jgi:REP element-mobilizing transposase RayT
MPRRPRHEGADAVHHVVFQGNGRCRVVEDRTDAERFWSGFALACDSFSWECIAACLLGTHFHAILRTLEPSLGKGTQRLLGAYARWFNLRHQREGHLFRSPFWSGRIETMEHLVVSVSYVALNPVRAGLCGHPSGWPWTTHRELAGLEPSRVVKADGVLSFLGNNDIARGRAAYARMIEDDLERLLCTPAPPPLETLASSIQHGGRAGGAKASPHARAER